MSRLAFFGTPAHAVPTLQALAAEHEVGLVVTRPDRPRGRSGAPLPPPVKEAAARTGLPVAQPEDAASLERALTDAGHLDVGVVVAYGRILRPAVLDIPERGILNLHFSLLPRWRGASPVARALIAGDTMTGVTVIRLDEGLDTGPVLTAQAVDVMADEDAGDLTGRLALLGARLLTGILPAYLAGEVTPVPQSGEGMTLAPRIGPQDRPLGAVTDPDAFVARVRGLAPRPGATLVVDGDVHRVLKAHRVDTRPEPGTWVAGADGPVVSVGTGAVALTVLQRPGGRAQDGAAWIRGRHRQEGTVG
jgi:methionyl-tRNA formyltransferase